MRWKFSLFGIFILLLFCNFAFAKNVNVKFNFPLNYSTADVKSAAVNVSDDSNAFNAFAKAAQQNSIALDVAYYDFDGDGVKESAFINSVNSLSASDDFSKYWQFSLSNVPSMAGVSSSIPNNSDTISLDYLDGSTIDALEWLSDNQSNGKFGLNIFQSGFGLMAISKAADNNANLPSNVSTGGINYVLTQQQSDGSFGDELNTAVATMALLSNGLDLNDFSKNGKNAIDLLKEKQRDDGGFKSGSTESDVDTTSWATIAFMQAGENLPSKSNKNPIDFLKTAQHSNGSFGYNAIDSTESIDFTEEAIIAFAAAKQSKNSIVSNSLNWLSLKQDSDGCISDGFRTALGSIAFRAYNETEKADKALNCLKTKANGDGSFGRTSNFSNALDTGLAVLALSKSEFPLTVAQTDSNSSGLVGLNSVAKFLVKIKNMGKVSAKNVKISLNGIHSNWILNNSQGSIDFFDSILPNETKTAEIFAKLESIGTYNVQAVISSDTSSSNYFSENKVDIGVEEAKLAVSISVQ